MLRTFLAAAILLTSAASARAGFEYSLEASLTTPGASPVTSFSGVSSVSLNLFLVQRDVPGGAGAPGFSAVTGSFDLSKTGFGSVSAQSAASGLASTSGATTSFTNLWSPFAQAATGADPTFWVQLGSVTIDGNMNQPTSFSFVDNDMGGSDAGLFITDVVNGANSVDGSAFSNSGTVNVTFSAVPEPGSLSLLGVAALGFCFRRRR